MVLSRHSRAEEQPRDAMPSPSVGGVPVTAQLTWERRTGGEECISGDALRAAVNGRWGREVLRGQGGADLELRGVIGPRGDGTWVAQLEMRRADGSSLGSREIATHAGDCRALDDSVALAAGLMLDMSRQRLEEERAAPRPERDLRPLAGPSIQIPTPRPPWRAEVQAGGEAAVGMLPGTSLGLRPGLAIDSPTFWRVEAGATWWAPTEKTTDGRGARFSALTLDLAICPLETRRLRPLVLRGCVSQRLGLVRAEGIGFPRSESGSETVYAIGPRGTVSWFFARPVKLVLGVRADLPLARYRFVYEDATQRTRSVYSMSVLTAGVDLSLAVRF